MYFQSALVALLELVDIDHVRPEYFGITHISSFRTGTIARPVRASKGPERTAALQCIDWVS